jgi:hypothetical protein
MVNNNEIAKSGSYVRRSKKTVNYTTIDNRVFDLRMSVEAIGILFYVLSKPDDWVVRKIEIQNRFNLGKDKLTRIFKELEHFGFIVEVGSIKSINGKFAGYCYIFYDYEEALENNKAKLNINKYSKPLSEKPQAVQPLPVNPPLISNEEKKSNEKEKVLNKSILIREEDPNFKNLDFKNKEVKSIEETEFFKPKNQKEKRNPPCPSTPLSAVSEFASEIVAAWNEFNISKQLTVPNTYLSKIETLFVNEGVTISEYKKAVYNMKLSGYFEKEGRSLNFLTTLDENYFYRFLNWMPPKKQAPMYKSISFD